GARSKLWRQIQADVFNTPIHTITVEEGPALGAVLLAGVGTGIYNDVPEACQAVIDIEDSIAPREENVAIYDKYYKVYGELYHSLKAHYIEVANIEKNISNT